MNVNVAILLSISCAALVTALDISTITDSDDSDVVRATEEQPGYSAPRLADSDALARIRQDPYVYAVIVVCPGIRSELARQSAANMSHLLAEFGVKMFVVNAFGNEFERAFGGAYAEGPLPSLLLFDALGNPPRPRLLSTKFTSLTDWVEKIADETSSLDIDAHTSLKLKRGAGPPQFVDATGGPADDSNPDL